MDRINWTYTHMNADVFAYECAIAMFVCACVHAHRYKCSHLMLFVCGLPQLTHPASKDQPDVLDVLQKTLAHSTHPNYPYQLRTKLGAPPILARLNSTLGVMRTQATTCHPYSCAQPGYQVRGNLAPMWPICKQLLRTLSRDQ